VRAVMGVEGVRTSRHADWMISGLPARPLSDLDFSSTVGGMRLVLCRLAYIGIFGVRAGITTTLSSLQFLFATMRHIGI
jgi:hypothetical protein